MTDDLGSGDWFALGALFAAMTFVCEVRATDPHLILFLWL